MAGSYRTHVIICGGAGCVSSGCKQVKAAFLDELKKNELEGEVKVVETGCIGSCDLGPVIVIYPEGVFYKEVSPKDTVEIIEEHLLKGRPVERLMYDISQDAQIRRTLEEIEFFKRQKKVVLRNTGIIDPDSIEEYIARDGYSSLAKVLDSMTPEEVISEIKQSGLRGRGGAGFPTGLKWEFTAKAEGDTKYVVCNADEGDPGAFMDRSILEGDPHSIIEAMAIAGYAIGASEGFVYVRAEYPLAVDRLTNAISQAEKYELLGDNVLDSNFSFNMEIRVGAGAFVCGEETALMASIEGKRGMPKPKPPFPAQKGLWGCPTVINNVETLANIPVIILNGGKEFAKICTDKSKGTKVFALAGNINNTGLVEVPLGTTLKEVIYDIGGGIPDGKGFKAAQIGGPSGGCIPAEDVEVPLEYESLIDLGAMMGSGGLIVMDDETCMVDIARFFLDFTQDESCGKCVPCREGTKVMLDILTRITEGEGKEGDIELLEKLGNTIKKTSLCGLGQSAPNPVISTIKYFRDEYESHIKEGKCIAGACKALVSYSVLPENCRGCGLCAKACPVHAIDFYEVERDKPGKKRKKIYRIDQEKCIKCGDCQKACPFEAVLRS